MNKMKSISTLIRSAILRDEAMDRNNYRILEAARAEAHLRISLLRLRAEIDRELARDTGGRA